MPPAQRCCVNRRAEDVGSLRIPRQQKRRKGGGGGGGGGCHLVGLVEAGADVAPEEVAGAPGGQAPALDVLGVAPQQVAHRPVVRHLLLAVYRPDLHRPRPRPRVSSALDPRRAPPMTSGPLTAQLPGNTDNTDNTCVIRHIEGPPPPATTHTHTHILMAPAPGNIAWRMQERWGSMVH